MKGNFSKILCVLLAVGLLVCMTGCNLVTKQAGGVRTEIITQTTTTTTTGAGDETGDATGDATGDVTGGGTTTTTKGGGDSTVTTNTEKKLTGTLELQIFVGGYGNEAWEYAIEEFEKAQPGLEVNAHMDANVNSQMRTRWSKNNPPDFVFIEGTNLPAETWMEEGKMRDLSDLYNNGYVYGTNKKVKDQLKDNLVYTYGNTKKIYKMPLLLNTYGMWYDQTMFTQKGWKVPTNYSELLSFSEKAKKAGVNPIIYTGQHSGYVVMGMWFSAVAAEALDSGDLQYFYDWANAKTESVWSDARFKNVLKKFDTLAEKGYFDLSGLSMNHITSQAAWLKRTSALIPNGLWLENEMKDSTPDDFQMRFYPSMLQDADQENVVVLSDISVGVAQYAKNPEAAEAFIRFLYTDAIAVKFAELCGVPVATKTDVSKANLTATAKQANQMINSPDVTVVPKGDTSWGNMNSTVGDVANQIVSRKYSVDEAIEVLKKATKKQNG